MDFDNPKRTHQRQVKGKRINSYMQNNKIKYSIVYTVYLIGFWIVMSQLSHAQSGSLTQYNNLGYAPYGMMSDNWDCDAQIAADTGLKELRLAVLWNTFGTNAKCLSRYMQDVRLKALEIHLINEVCQRHDSCGSYEFLYGVSIQEYNKKLIHRNPELLNRMAVYFKNVADFLANNLNGKNTVCYINPGLESNVTYKAAHILIQQAKKAFPNCKIVWNPVGSNPAAKPIEGTVFELHGPKATLTPPCIADLDGVDISYPTRPALLPENIPSSQLPQVAESFKSCDLNLFWIAEYNSLTSQNPPPDPRLRKSFPSEKTFSLVTGSIKDLS